MASDMPLLRETCTIFYARNFFHFLLPTLPANHSLFDFDNFRNIQNIHDGGFGGSTAAFSGCLPPAKGEWVVLLIVVCVEDATKASDISELEIVSHFHRWSSKRNLKERARIRQRISSASVSSR